jgi:membrane-associated phospholipid phosphatase
MLQMAAGGGSLTNGPGSVPPGSYPSGHTTTMFALAAVLAVIMLNPPGRALTPVLRFIIPTAAVALACVISTRVIGLGSHYFTDTIAGAAAGVGTVAATALVLDLPGPRRWLAAADVQLRKLHARRSRGALASTRPST